jgi:hypothetical protein
MRRLADLGTKPTVWSKFNSILFRHEAVSKIIYPILRVGRYVLLFLLGRRQLPRE